jgi:hypothetical protein
LTLSPNEYFGPNPDLGAIKRQFPASNNIIDVEPEILVYPNPNNGICYMDLSNYDNSIKCEVFNSAGQMLEAWNMVPCRILYS